MPAKLRHSFFFVFFFLLVFLFTLYYCFYLFVYYSPTSNLVACFFITWTNALTIFLFLCVEINLLNPKGSHIDNQVNCLALGKSRGFPFAQRGYKFEILT